MRLPDNSWSPLVFWSLPFLLKILRFVLKRQCLLQCFRNVELIEMPLLPHNRLKEWTEKIYKTHDIKKLLFSFSSFSGKKNPTEHHKPKKKYTPVKNHPKQNPQKPKVKKPTSSDILGLNCKWYVHHSYHSRSLSKLLEKTSTLQITL